MPKLGGSLGASVVVVIVALLLLLRQVGLGKDVLQLRVAQLVEDAAMAAHAGAARAQCRWLRAHGWQVTWFGKGETMDAGFRNNPSSHLQLANCRRAAAA